MIELSKKLVLVIDDMEGMRTQLRITLSNTGFCKFHMAANVKEAIARMEENAYDLILCDYSMGDGTDGQQFLEYLRSKKIISSNTLFVMITAEQSYEKVVAASECAPDDYLLKPFTGAQFMARIERLLEKQAYFFSLDKAIDEGNWKQAISLCDIQMELKDKFYFELLKTKGGILMSAGAYQQALAVYKQSIAIRPVGWARLGLARALAASGDTEDALNVLDDLIKDMPQFIAAYDQKGKMLIEAGDQVAALEVYQQARRISPGTLERIRELTALALSAGKPDLAEEIMGGALRRHKFSPVREINDFILLSRSLIDLGRAAEALSVLDEAKKLFPDGRGQIQLFSFESIAHQNLGNIDKAHVALEMAEQKQSSADEQSTELDAVALTGACLALHQDEKARAYSINALKKGVRKETLKRKIREVYMRAGRDPSIVDGLVSASEQEIKWICDEAMALAKCGNLAGATDLITSAAEQFKNSVPVISNAAVLIALDLLHGGMNAVKLGKCLSLRKELLGLYPTHPKLSHIDWLLKQLRSTV